MIAEANASNRVVLRIQLTTAAKDDLNDLGDRLGIPQNRIMIKLVQWLSEQHGGVRNIVLGLVPEDMTKDTAKWLLSNT